MLHVLEQVYEEGKPFDEQTACIEEFFGNDAFWKNQFDFEDDGSDENTEKMIDLVLNNLSADIPKHLIDMLNFWKVEGF